MELLEEGGIETLIQDNLEENIPPGILEKLQKRFNLSEEKAKEQFEKYSSQTITLKR